MAGCQRDSGLVGFTLEYRCIGDHSIGVRREQFEGQSWTYGPGALGCKPRDEVTLGAQMSYMPDDRHGKMPTWVEVEWMVATPEYDRGGEKLFSRQDKYSDQWKADLAALNASAPRYTRRVDLTQIITPALLTKVQKNRNNTQLKLTFTFDGDRLDVKAEALKWR